MSLVDCWCCPCFRRKPKLCEDEPLLVILDPHYTKLNSAEREQLYDDDEEWAIEIPNKDVLRQSSDSDKMHTINKIYTGKRKESNSEDMVETLSEKVPLWQQIERIKSPSDDRPPLWN